MPSLSLAQKSRTSEPALSRENLQGLSLDCPSACKSRHAACEHPFVSVLMFEEAFSGGDQAFRNGQQHVPS